MNKKVLKIVGGILQILAGALWLIVVLVYNRVFGIGYLEIIGAIALILIGIIVCSNKLKKDNDVIVFGILDIALIVVQFVFGSYVGMGVIPIVLLLISAIMFFISKPSKNDK